MSDNLQSTRPIIVVWQSLVVSGYRSFFYELQKTWPNNIYLVAPQHFIELGSQDRPCEAFSDTAAIPANRCFSLPSYNWHVQAVHFRGLGEILRRVEREHAIAPTILCIAEPYSITALLCLIQAKHALKGSFHFYTYALQNIDKSFSLPIRAIEKILFRNSNQILSLGPGQTKVLRSHGYSEPILDFPLWFDSQVFSHKLSPEQALQILSQQPRLEGNLPSLGKPVVGFCGSMFAEKGIYDLLELWQQNEDLRSKYHLFLAGQGRSLDDVVLKARKLNEEFGASIVHFGGLRHDAMAAFYSLLDVLVVPSRTTENWKEQFGRIIVEAQACGAVVIGSDSGEIPFVIDDPVRIFPEGDISQMVSCLKRALTLNPSSREQIRRKNYLRFSDVELAKSFASQLQGPSRLVR